MRPTQKDLNEAQKILSSNAGKACLKKHGRKFYSRIAKEGWEKRKKA